MIFELDKGNIESLKQVPSQNMRKGEYQENITQYYNVYRLRRTERIRRY